MQITSKNGLLRSTILAGLAAAASGAPALAQQTETEETTEQPAAGQPAQGDEVIQVTGSRIARDVTNAPNQIIQLDNEDIALSGEPNLVDFLADVPALQGSQVPEDTTGSSLNNGGLSLLNLRNLGAVRTLTLVDGRRHVGSNPGTLSVDVDTIPSMLVERVDVITGGQSAVYGADAVSGVVNFIMRDDFDGIEVDAAYSQINQDGQANQRISAAIGENFLDGRLNVYAFGEYQESDEVMDFDIDWRRRATGLLTDDIDPAGQSADGVFDDALFSDIRNLSRARGGTVVLANQPRPSATDDPNTPFQECEFDPESPDVGVNCQAIRADQPGTVYVFEADGTPRLADFGSDQPGAGFSRPSNSGGDGLNSGTEFGQGSRVPYQEAKRFQAGFNFDVTPDITLFGEAKYVEEENFDTGQPTFFNITLSDERPSTLGGINVFSLGLDNAYLNRDAPELRVAIENNTRPVYAEPTSDAPGEQIGEESDPRALLTNFGPSRSQLNQRDLTRFVLGAEGRFDDFAFFRNNTWEVSYTYGEMNNSNFETGVDSERYFYASDAVFDTNNVLGGGADNIVCRAQIQAAQNGSIPDLVGRTDSGELASSDPAIANCIPVSPFGTDLRSDANNPEATGGGGRPGLTGEVDEYLNATIEVTNTNRQQNFIAFGSTETWDFWGAGPIGFAGGYEYRQEETEGTGRDRDTNGRLLFLNTGPDFETADYDVNEVFGEVRVPLLDDQLFMESAEISGAYRYSDYSTVGEVETYSVQGQIRPTQDFFVRATYGEAVRIPNLGENFAPPSQTFGNGLVDPCSPDGIRDQSNLDASERDRLRENCVATLPDGYDPGSDEPGSGSPSSINYSSGIPGANQGNPDLEPEESTSYTVGFAVTPRWVENFSFTADYYKIEIENVIASVSIQDALNQCVGFRGDEVGSVNQNACETFSRSADPEISQQPEYGIFDFIQGSLNYAGLETQGIDFTAGYSYDLGRYGFIDWSLRGNYLIENNEFTNVDDPSDETAFDDEVEYPRWRTLSTLAYSPIEEFTLSWAWDWQSSQEIFDEDEFEANMDRRDLDYYRTGDFNQHNFTVAYSPVENVRLRAGVVNAFDEEPAVWLGPTTTADNFDFFGRRFFIGINATY